VLSYLAYLNSFFIKSKHVIFSQPICSNVVFLNKKRHQSELVEAYY
jgi:hypothetical protein